MRPERYPPLARFERSPLTQLVIDRLASTAVGEMVSYAELSALCRCDIQGPQGRTYLDTARRIVLKQSGMVFGTHTGEGIRRLDDPGVIGLSDHNLKRVERAAKRGVAQLATVTNTERLSMLDRGRLVANRARLGMVRLFAGKRAATVIAAATEAHSLDPKVAQRKALDIFRVKS